MNDDLDDGISITLDFVEKVTITRFLSGSLIPSNIFIRAEVLPTNKVEEIDFDITFSKIKFWFENIVAKSVIFCKHNKMAAKMMLNTKNGHPNTMNHLMITPHEPTDDHLATLLQSKMAALSAGKIEFGCVRIRSDSSNGLMFTYIGNWEDDLPGMKEWFNAKPYYFSTPWWTRNDVSMIDLKYPDATVRPPWAFTLDFIEESIRPKPKRKSSKKKVEEVIKFAQPKIIDGGEDSEE